MTGFPLSLALSALFQLTAYTEDERTRHLFKGDTVIDCITSADHWVTNRDGIWNALNLLETTTELSVCEPILTPEGFLITCDRICLMSTLRHAKQNERKPGLTTIRRFLKK